MMSKDLQISHRKTECSSRSARGKDNFCQRMKLHLYFAHERMFAGDQVSCRACPLLLALSPFFFFLSFSLPFSFFFYLSQFISLFLVLSICLCLSLSLVLSLFLSPPFKLTLRPYPHSHSNTRCFSPPDFLFSPPPPLLQFFYQAYFSNPSRSNSPFSSSKYFLISSSPFPSISLSLFHHLTL